ncbi:alpha/beta fold hydrolase [Chishuiella sp.]|uniref:alpha/beta fold hydrolase n=1 Tax=Chishuiella sp. TaxID=1969467 RepID=UPI0028AAD350|nr:alpha/beta fold hydrolase [Chishuiella sp.]
MKKKYCSINILVYLLLCNNYCFSQKIFPYEKDFLKKENKKFIDVDFYDSINKAYIKGTLVTPNKEFDKVVIIIPGSDKDTRYNHFDLAENMVENGIAVYRFDELGIGESEGKYSPSIEKLINSTKYAFLKIKELDITKNKKIGLLGHSLGGIATIETYSIFPKNIDFLIQFSTPVKNLGSEFIWRAKVGKEKYFTVKNKTPEEVSNLLIKIFDFYKNTELNKPLKIRDEAIKIAKKEGFLLKDSRSILVPYYQEYMKYDLENLYKNIDIPTLYIISKSDNIVNPIANIVLLKKLNNTNITIVESNGLGHYLSAEKKEQNQSAYIMEESSKQNIINFIKNV